MARYIVAPIADRARVRGALLSRLAAALGRRIVGGEMEDLPAGTFGTTQAVPERVSRDGLFVGFELDDALGVPFVLKEPVTRTDALRVEDLAGTRVDAVNVPAISQRDESFFADRPTPRGRVRDG